MSQQGFPNGGILPDNGNNTYSNLIRTEAQIREIAGDLARQAFADGAIHPTQQVTIATQAEGILTATLGLAQYWWQQVTYQGNDGYGSANNPVSPVMSAETNTAFMQMLGSSADPQALYQNYENSSNGPRNLTGVQNFFFNLGLGSDAFSWDSNGNLNINDTYVFTGINDFGIAPPEALRDAALSGDPGAIAQVIPYLLGGMVGVVIGGVIFGPTAVLRSGLDGINEIIANVFFNGLRPDGDSTRGFDWSLWRDENGNPLNANFGEIEPMAIRKTFTPDELYEANPALFFDAVNKGLIPFSALIEMENFVCNSLEVGVGPSAFLPNYPSVASDIGSDPSNWTLGGGGNYPRPFTSFGQRINEATYSLGPFAKFGNVSGRIGNLSLLCVDTDVTDLGFIRQDWYNADRGNSIYASSGELEKWQWWDQANKSKIRFPYGHLPGNPELEIEVATASYANSSIYKYSVDLPTPNDYTLLVGMVILAATLRI